MKASIPEGLDRKEAEAYSHLDHHRLPQHIAIIMDGNGRWANRRHLPRIAGHKAGVTAVRSTIETAARIGIPYLTLYAFSSENWKRRPAREVNFLMRLLKQYLRLEVPLMMRTNIQLDYIGRLHELPDDVQAKLDWARETTSRNTGLKLTLALNYGARLELADACTALLREALKNGVKRPEISEEDVARVLYTRNLPDPDLVIRTSGEMRLSNFLLWQSAYAEIYVTKYLWPDFRGLHLIEAIGDYQKRERRYGGLVSANGSAGSRT